MLWIWSDSGAVRKQSLNLFDRKTMLLTFPTVAIIPIESTNAQIHEFRILHKCIYATPISA